MGEVGPCLEMVANSVLEQQLHTGAIPTSYTYLFQPLAGIWLAINRLFMSDSWEDVLKDPYLLINASFETWYELIDESAWKLLDLSREAEKVRYSRFSSRLQRVRRG